MVVNDPCQQCGDASFSQVPFIFLLSLKICFSHWFWVQRILSVQGPQNKLIVPLEPAFGAVLGCPPPLEQTVSVPCHAFSVLQLCHMNSGISTGNM